MKPRYLLAPIAASALLASVLGTPAYAVGADVVPAAANPIAGQYTVVLDDSVTDVRGAAKKLAAGAKITRVYTNALKGFTVRTNAAGAKRIAAKANVDTVQQDSTVRANDVQPETTFIDYPPQSVPAPPNTFWGLNRIDQRGIPANAAGTYNYHWIGSQVTAYVVDTGINYSHADFEGRASLAVDLVGDGFVPAGGDCYGHGTHVAGTIAGKTYGVAKKVKLKSVRVLDCGGSASYSTVIAGIDWLTANAAKPSVVNLSLGGGNDVATNLALNNMIESGVTAVVAAGNSNDDACNYSPASTLSAITVGSTGSYENPNAPISDARSSFSNYGACLDIFAPGAYIKSAWIGSNTATNTISGTSMAAPHVAGVAALYLAAKPTALPIQVRNALVANATTGKVTDRGAGSPNRLLYGTSKAVLSFDAGPEPVKSGAALTVTGNLSAGGRALAQRQVEVWFDKVGTTPPVRIGTATTDSAGNFKRVQRATGTGYWSGTLYSEPLIEGVDSAKDYVLCSNCS